MKRFLFGSVCILALACVIVVSDMIPLYATSIQEEESKKQDLENDLENVQGVISDLEQYISNEEAYIEKVDSEITILTDGIFDLQSQVKAKKKEIKAKKKEIKAAKKDIDVQYENMKKRIQFMFENSDAMYSQMILGSENVSDFLNRAEYINELTTYDREQLNKLQKAKKKLNKQKKKLESQQANLEQLIADEEKKRTDMQTLIANKKEVVEGYEADITEQEAAALEIQAEIEAQEAIIAELIELERKRKEEEERRRQEALLQQQNANLPTYDGGQFLWPVPGYYRISSEYGTRSDPFTGLSAWHNGLDIPAPEGTPIIAAYSGEVIWAYYSASAGNWIGIDHGDGIVTIYMHASKLMVSEGDMVSAGQTIALVGTTGRSTGNHLHFTIRVNGSDVNPHNYVG